MNRLLACVALFLAACSALPEEGPATKTLSGRLVFPETTALPPSAIARVSVLPTMASGKIQRVAELEIPATTSDAIPFELKIPAERVSRGGEYLVVAQVIDHGVVWYSNLTHPLRISFIADPGELEILLRAEPR